MFNNILEIIRGKKILVIGDIMLDHYIFGSVKRISPEAPVPIVNVQRELNSLGGCGNVISNLHNLGLELSLICMIGGDTSGGKILEKLELMKINLDNLIIEKNIITTNKMRIIGDSQHITRADWDVREISEFEENKILNLIEKTVPLSDAVIVSDYAKGVCTQLVLEKLIECANKLKIPIFVDPKGKNWEKYNGATFITPNTAETSSVINKKLFKDKDFHEAGKMILDKYNIKYCLITRGSQGMSLIGAKEYFHVPTKAREIYDVSGAGDTVISCLAAAIIGGASIEEAVEFSNFAAGIVVGCVGTAAITRKELEEL